jgi:hypothetical protein
LPKNHNLFANIKKDEKKGGKKRKYVSMQMGGGVKRKGEGEAAPLYSVFT